MGQLRYFAGLALHARRETLVGPGRLNYTLRQPYGVVGRIVPFNHPLLFAAAKIAAPLIAGNTVVLKPSEHTSLSALALAEHLADIFPAGVVNVVTGFGAEAGDALVAHPEVRRLAFIGWPTRAGRSRPRRRVAVKHVTLESAARTRSSSSPTPTWTRALEGVAARHELQLAGAVLRLDVAAARAPDIHGEFVEALAERIDALRSGLPEDPATDTGAIVSRRPAREGPGYIELGRAEGARSSPAATASPTASSAVGLFIRPRCSTTSSPDARLAQEEIFGPVLAAIPSTTTTTRSRSPTACASG